MKGHTHWVTACRCCAGVALGLAMTSCASFRSGDLSEKTFDAWPPALSGQKRSITISLSGVAGELYNEWKTETERAYQDSGLFSQAVVSPRGGSDLRAVIEITHVGKANMLWAILTGLTLYIIPSSASDEYSVTTTFYDQQENVVATSTHKEKNTLWQQLFLIFLTPFKSPDSVSRETFYDFSRAAILDARQANAL